MITVIGVDGADASKTVRCCCIPDRTRSLQQAMGVNVHTKSPAHAKFRRFILYLQLTDERENNGNGA